MNKLFNRTLHLVLPLAGVLLATPTAVHADDTEIFTGATFAETQPNVLFIMDTSGSMDGIVAGTAEYDPAVVYEGDCPEGRIYWSTSAYEVPGCGSSRWFDESALRCDAALSPLATEGRFRDRIARYRDHSDAYYRRWRALHSDVKNQLVDCKADHGVHGDGVDVTKNWAAERNSGPYAASSAADYVLNWDNEWNHTLYTSNYVNFKASPLSQEKTRLQVVREVVQDVLNNTTGINVGMMRFSSYGNGGMVVVPMTPIEAGGREATNAALAAMDHQGNTPLSETLYEAVRYFRGMSPYFGMDTYGTDYVWQPSISTSLSDGKYVSPIVDQCQRNFVVLLTDGEPTSDYEADTATKNLAGFSTATSKSSCSGNCLDELAGYLQNRDLSDSYDEDQVVDTYTIGFHTDQQLLEDTAIAGNGKYYTALNAAELTNAFADIFEDIESKDASFTSPALAVNSFNRLNHLNDLYFTVFTPSLRPHWTGNLKRYKLGEHQGNLEILDKNDAPAVDEATGGFDMESQSYWTLNGADGHEAAAGGFASRLLTSRRVYTNASGDTSNVILSAAGNQVHENNTTLTQAVLQVGSADERLDVLRWARGIDADDQSTHVLGDAMHSKPVIISWGGTPGNLDLTLFYSTNDGFLHAVDPNAGDTDEIEVFSFIPHDLLPNLRHMTKNEPMDPKKVYGLDGQLTYWISGDDGNGIVDDGEKLMLYFGMRRGGRNFYALDVTDRANPKLKWEIKGGSGDFAELGQTWSEAAVARVRINGAPKDVLLMAGGYDPNQDAAGASSDDSMGRAIYMIDANNGTLLWWAANATDHPGADLALSDMTHSIPSNMRVIDMNSDGYHDRIYVGDTGSQVWRFDIDNWHNSGKSDLVSGGVIADLGGSLAADNRRFYYAPSVSLVSDD